MKNVNRKMKEFDIETILLFDKETAKGYPTDDSLVITIAFTEKTMCDGDLELQIGTAVKLPGEPHIQRIGNTIAVNRLLEGDCFVHIRKERFDTCGGMWGAVWDAIVERLDILVPRVTNKKTMEAIIKLRNECVYDLYMEKLDEGCQNCNKED